MSGSILMRSMANLFSPNRIMLGVGAAKEVGSVAKSMGGQRAIVITDPGVAKVGLADEIKASLMSHDLKVEIFDRVELEPPARVVDECAALIREKGLDLIVGLGGGSSMDTAKMTSIMATNEGKILDYVGMEKVPRKALPKILLPTTAGSGAEVTRSAGVTDESKNTKQAIFSVYNLADAAILDPLLTLSLPGRLTAETGVDALAHAIESFVSFSGTPFSDILAIEAIRLVSENLPVAFAKGEHLEARYNMQLAATLAGLAMASGRSGATHGLAFVLETAFNLGHAKAIAIMLSHVMDYNKTGNLKKYALIARAMGESGDGLSDYDAAERSVVRVRNLLASLNLSTRLPEYGISMDKLPVLVEGGMKQSGWFVHNPRNLAEDDVRHIYLKALQ
jgi:alcohol dehydrogenase